MTTEFDDIIKVPNRGFYVPSASFPGMAYLVEFPGGCPCKAAVKGNLRCRHMKRLLAMAAADRAKHARPVAPVNISAMVD